MQCQQLEWTIQAASILPVIVLADKSAQYSWEYTYRKRSAMSIRDG